MFSLVFLFSIFYSHMEFFYLYGLYVFIRTFFPYIHKIELNDELLIIHRRNIWGDRMKRYFRPEELEVRLKSHLATGGMKVFTLNILSVKKRCKVASVNSLGNWEQTDLISFFMYCKSLNIRHEDRRR